ncbi:MAG: phosphoenolpyruvate synthase [Patescibacteria group bacterium]|nr:phosphoenolpyruvate synthase [Patescibacteria group bacterium]
MKKYVAWFKEVNKDDLALVGGKGANLGEMIQAGFPVPDGFIVTSDAYYQFLDEDNLRSVIHETLAVIDVNNTDELEEAAKKVQDIITHANFPKDVAKDIIDAYFALSGALKNALVAVRSSATAEDLSVASFAGQQSTFLNVKGEANLIEKVREVWASLFTARAIFYRATNHFDHFKVGIAVPVQRMIESESSGIMFTIDPITNDKSKVIIEAIHGLGEMIVQGAVTPDHYEVDKKTGDILVKVIKEQEKLMIQQGTGNLVRACTPEEAKSQKLSDEQIKELAQIGINLEKHYYFPQDIEWAMEKGTLYIVQTRPVTTVENHVTQAKEEASHVKHQVFLKGDPASPGIASGTVKILHSAEEIHRVEQGDVLVAEQTNPDFVPAMRKAVAIVTERGGRTSHAAIVSRELGIPAVVGTADAMTKLRDGMTITVNGTLGEIYEGVVEIHETKQAVVTEYIKTATKVYVNLAEPSRAQTVSQMNVDGVGLLRAEFMIADIGVHPRKLIEEKQEDVFINTLAEKLEIFCKAFQGKPVVYRATDFKTNEYRGLKGGEAFEPQEPNPMLGFRGAARYVADARVFQIELAAIKKVRNEYGYKNLWMMIPFVRTPKELEDVKAIMEREGLERSHDFKLWLMCEIPTNVIRLEDFIRVGIDGVSIGSNDLTMLILGTDRDNSEVAHDFNELDPSVLWAFERVIKTCVQHNITVSMCGQAPSDYPDLVEKLVSWGITSVSVNPDAVNNVRETILHAERRLIRNT